MSISALGGGGSKPPSPPPFNPINVSNVANAALGQDISKYFSYSFPVFPGMTALRQSEIADAYKQLSSPLSPDFESTFTKSALSSQAGVTGSGNLYSGMALKPGSFAKGDVSANVTRQTLAKQDYDRARLESLQQSNPIPGLGLSQNDLLSLYTYNTGAQNAYTMGNYANSIAGANAAYAAQQANFGAIGNAISGLGSAYYNYNLYSNLFNNSSFIPGGNLTAAGATGA